MVCRAKRADASLVRAAQLDDASWYLGRGPGRGVWWCSEGDCGEKLSAAHVARALRRAVNEVSFGLLERLRASN